MKVIVLTWNAVDDYENYGIGTQVFSSWDKATEEFKKLRDKEKAIVEDKGWTISSDCETDFEAYLEGYYVSHHTVGSLEEVEVQ
jgi:hypothetical protein